MWTPSGKCLPHSHTDIAATASTTTAESGLAIESNPRNQVEPTMWPTGASSCCSPVLGTVEFTPQRSQSYRADPELKDDGSIAGQDRAWQQKRPPPVRFGSKADMSEYPTDVHSTSSAK